MIVIIFLINGTITNDELRMPLSVIPNGVRIPYGEERFITHTLNDKCPNAKGANGRENQLRITRYECEYIIVYAP